jgi:hypothetical protein
MQVYENNVIGHISGTKTDIDAPFSLNDMLSSAGIRINKMAANPARTNICI